MLGVVVRWLRMFIGYFYGDCYGWGLFVSLCVGYYGMYGGWVVELGVWFDVLGYDCWDVVFGIEDVFVCWV